MTPSLAEARAVAREHPAWAASQGVWPGDLLVGIGVRRLYGVRWQDAETILALAWLRLPRRSAAWDRAAHFRWRGEPLLAA